MLVKDATDIVLLMTPVWTRAYIYSIISSVHCRWNACIIVYITIIFVYMHNYNPYLCMWVSVYNAMLGESSQIDKYVLSTLCFTLKPISVLPLNTLFYQFLHGNTENTARFKRKWSQSSFIIHFYWRESSNGVTVSLASEKIRMSATSTSISINYN